MSYPTSISFLSALLAVGSLAQASTLVDFNDLTLASYENSFSDGGWSFSAVTTGPGPVNLAAESDVGLLSSDVSDHVVNFGFPFVDGSPVTEVTVRQSDLAPFTLESLWLGDGFGNSQMRIEGYRNGSSAGYQPVDVDIFGTALFVEFTGWDEIDEIRFTNSSGAQDLNFDLDDLTISPVPEPSIAGLAVLGVLALSRRRRR